jgi:cyclopropane fatty-acyl-phospholipid synthase-like methyltransferase
MSLKSAIIRQFSRPSGPLGALAGAIMARRSSNRARNAETLARMGLAPGLNVVEIGCGPGVALAACAGAVAPGRVVGLDHSPLMIAQARARLARAGHAEVALACGGPERLAAWPEAFDRAFSINLIAFIADKPSYFRAVRAALVPGGSCYTTYQPRLSADAGTAAQQMQAAVVAAMEEAGFTDIAVAPIAAGGTAALCISGRA